MRTALLLGLVLAVLPSWSWANGVSSRLGGVVDWSRPVPSMRVTWIGWDSSFRGSTLAIGDFITGVITPNGTRLNYEWLAIKNGNGIGGYLEETFWDKLGARDGDSFSLIVQKDPIDNAGPPQEFILTGQLYPERFYYTPGGRSALGDNGPDRLARDGFTDKAWMFWYEDFTKLASFIQDGAWNKNAGFDNRQQLQSWMEVQKPRVDFLALNHPGRFASAVASDYAAVVNHLVGELRTVDPTQQEWRRMGRDCLKTAKVAAIQASSKIIQDEPAKWIDPFPAPNPLKDDIASHVGKWVALPKASQRHLTSDLGKSYAVLGSFREGYLIVPLNTPQMDIFFDTFFQFMSTYASNLRYEYNFFGKVTADAAMISYDGRVITGLLVEPFAAYVGNSYIGDVDYENIAPAYFVDMRKAPSVPVRGTPRLRFEFAGESDMPKVNLTPPAPDASPVEVVQAMVEAVKYSNQDLWISLVAPWSFYYRGDYPPVFQPTRELYGIRSSWEHSRALLTDTKDRLPDVAEALARSHGRITTVFQGDPTTGVPMVEEVKVLLDHIGEFNGEYRVFTNRHVRRVWTLQRIHGGPWKIVDVDHL